MVKLLATSVAGVDMNGLRDLGDQLKGKLGEGVVVLASEADGKVNLVAMATEEAMKKGAHAGNLIIVVDAGSVDQILPISIISTDIVDLISCILCHLGHFGEGFLTS